METLAQLVGKRGRAKAVITRNLNWYTSNKEELKRGEIIHRQEQIKMAFRDFNEIQEKIDILCKDEEEIQIQELERTQFESDYFRIAGIFEDFLHLDRSGNNSNASSANSDLNEALPEGSHLGSHIRNSSSNHNVNVKLPQLSLPDFYGAYDKWASFHDLFKSLIHNNSNLANVQKMYYLQSSLKGEAAEIIAGLELTDDNYKTAWDILVERYENKRKRINTHLQNILDLPSVHKESSDSLKNLMDSYQKNMRALDNLEDPNMHWNSFLLFLLESKLDSSLNKDWDTKIAGSDLVTADKLIEFLKERFKSIDKKPNKRHEFSKSKDNFSKTHKIVNLSTNSTSCIICKEHHAINQCKGFLKLSPILRLNEIRKVKACTNCLKKGHFAVDCKSTFCKICQKRHHTLLHLGERVNSTSQGESSKTNNNELPSTCNSPSVSTDNISTHAQNAQEVVFLSTAVVYIFDSNNQLVKCRALLDSGSQSSFISRDLCNRLNLKSTKINVPILGINNTSSAQVNSKVVAKIKSINSNYSFSLPFLVLNHITGVIPQFKVDISSLPIPQNLLLADPEFFEPLEIDLLLGANIFFDLLLPNQIKIGKGQPLLQESKLGWVVSGPMDTFNVRKVHVHYCQTQDDNIHNQLEAFWSLEEAANNKGRIYSPEEEACEQDFVENFSRDDSGRFVVKLPVRANVSDLSSSRDIALRRFQGLEQKFSKDSDLKQQYSDFIREYIDLGHMSLVDRPDLEGFLYYLPHHCVKKETSLTTKLRVVFDASSKSENGLSLNDVLKVGPNIQDDVFSILLRFRTHNIAFTADIAKMYRQVLVHPEHQKLQCIFWRFNSFEPLHTYKLHTVTYGTGPASFLATRCLKQLAIENQTSYPETAASMINDFYMDDFISGEYDDTTAVTRIREISSILNSAGFVLRQWTTNKPRIFEKLNFDKAKVDYMIKDDQESKTLGLQWNPLQDIFYFTPHFNVKHRGFVTKRIILSHIAQLFDPLGLLGPIVITAKIILQDLWQIRSDWDDVVPDNILKAWNNFYSQLEEIKEIKIPRHFLLERCNFVELHGFSDASMKAYGACIYLKSRNNHGETLIALACAKSRVAPLKTISLPRLELCGALLLAQLFDRVLLSLKNVRLDNCYFWTDSTIVLSWLKSEPSSLKIFVANRVTKILEITDSFSWSHVPTQFNPADLISRGIHPKRLKKSDLWWYGPEFLRHDESFWPKSNFTKLEVIPELKEVSSLSMSVLTNNWILERYSSYDKLLNIVAYVLRFRFNACAKKFDRDKVVGSLQLFELERAKIVLLKLVQTMHFRSEIHNLTENETVSNKSKLKCLNPFLDEFGLIRVGGRLVNSSLSSDCKHPIVLPICSFTKLIILKFHLESLHGGPQLVLSRIRTEFWPLSGRRTVRSVLSKCVTCFKSKPLDFIQKMGNLPADRINVSRVFSKVGVDYAGPYLIKEVKYRNKKFVKAYICIFICLATKAIHIELVTDLTVDGFLNVLKRFIARRGLCSDIYSDNATNFTGASRELQNLVSLSDSDEFKNFLSRSSIRWHFIPPRSPHFGGLWESAVRSVKTHLGKVLHNVYLTYEDFYSLLTQIESIVNSRPLTPLTDDPNDFQPLTPGHFIIGDAMTSLPEHRVTKTETLRSRYKQLQLLIQHFWSRWSREYLHNLQVRSKWNVDAGAVHIGSLVLIKEEDTLPRNWKLGRIIELHPGKDNIVRAVTIKTTSGVLKRAMTKVCVLPVDC